MASPVFRKTVAALVLCVFAGCSTTATISQVSGPDFEVRILDSDSKALHVRDEDGREYPIPGEYVTDIDHPGNVNLLIGLGLVATSIPLMVGDLVQQSRDSKQGSDWSGMGLVVGIPTLITGLAFAIPAWLRYRHSKHAAQAFEDANPRLPIPRPVYPYPYTPPQPFAVPQP